jgi:ribosome-associated protein
MAKYAIADGQVSVDGHVELRKRRKIRQGQIVEFEAEQIRIVRPPK